MKKYSHPMVLFAVLLFVPGLAIALYAACANGIAGFADSYNE